MTLRMNDFSKGVIMYFGFLALGIFCMSLLVGCNPESKVYEKCVTAGEVPSVDTSDLPQGVELPVHKFKLKFMYTDGVLGLEAKNLALDMFHSANEGFYGIAEYVWDGQVHKVDVDTDMYRLTSDNINERIENENKLHEHLERVINVFIVPSSIPTEGYAYYPSQQSNITPNHNFIVIGTNVSQGNVFVHELGHFFGLPHDFETCGNFMGYGKCIRSFIEEQILTMRTVMQEFRYYLIILVE